MIDSVKEDARNSFNRLRPKRTKIRRSGRSFWVSGGYKKTAANRTAVGCCFYEGKGQSAEGRGQIECKVQNAECRVKVNFLAMLGNYSL